MFGDAVAEDGPVFGGGDGEGEDGFEVGLVECGEDALDVFHEELGVEVRFAVGGVGEAVHAFTGAGVAHGGIDAQFVRAGGECGERVPVLGEVGGVEGVSVEADGAQGGGLEFDEGVSGRECGELDDGAGVEGVLTRGQIEVDRVPVYVEELGSGLRFVARQYGHASMLPHDVGGAQWGSRRAECAVGGVRCRWVAARPRVAFEG